MWNEIVSAAIPILVPALVAVFIAILGIVGKYSIKVLVALRDYIVKKIGVTEYNRRVAIARHVWGIVEEDWRTHPELQKTVQAKQEAFAAYIEKYIKGITPDEIVQLRQTVAGIFNSGKAALAAPATAADAAVPAYTGQVVGTVEDTGTTAEQEAQTGADTAAEVKVQTSAQPDMDITPAAQASDTSADTAADAPVVQAPAAAAGAAQQ